MDSTKNSASSPNNNDLVLTNKAFHLGMTGGADFDAKEEAQGLRVDVEQAGAEVRPMRLGLGAKYLAHSQANRASSQVERKLRAKLGATRPAPGFLGGRRESRAGGDNRVEVVREAEDNGEDDEEGGSRTSVFKKRTNGSVTPVLIVDQRGGSKAKKKKQG